MEDESKYGLTWEDHQVFDRLYGGRGDGSAMECRYCDGTGADFAAPARRGYRGGYAEPSEPCRYCGGTGWERERD